MKSAPLKIEAFLRALRERFGLRDFYTRDVLVHADLAAIARTLVGKRGDPGHRLGRWFKLHLGCAVDGATLDGEYVKHRRTWIWRVTRETDGPAAEEIIATAEAVGMVRAEKFEAINVRTARGRTRFMNAAEKLQADREALASEMEELELKKDAPDNYLPIGERLKAQQAVSAHEQWAVELKAGKTMPACLDLLRAPYNPQPGERVGGIPGRWYVLTANEKRSGETAAAMHALICTPALRGMAQPVKLGETAQDRRLRKEKTKRVRVAARAEIPTGSPIADCPSSERAQLAAFGYVRVPPKMSGPMRPIKRRLGNWDL
jgi:hypothetical protein